MSTKDDPTIEQRWRDSAAQRIADYVKATTDAAPPLTEQQRDAIALLLRGGDHVS